MQTVAQSANPADTNNQPIKENHEDLSDAVI
jgi:hypothetical protein